MSRLPIAILMTLSAVLMAAPMSPACTFCSGSFGSRLTLRLQFEQAKVVVHGKLENSRFDARTNEGATDLKIETVLKDSLIRKGQSVLTLGSYLPTVGNTPRDYLVFCGTANEKMDPTFGLSATPALLAYIKEAARLDATDAAAKLGFFFKHLDSPDATIAADAFLEFARASDAEILEASRRFDPASIRKLIANPDIPPERLGVFAFLLGISGGPADAQFLAALLKENPLPERSSSAYGGLLAGYVLLAPRDGWQLMANVLGDGRQPYSLRLSTLGTLRFFQATRGKECMAEVLKCCAVLLPYGDLADQPIEDLRRWGYWDLTAEVLAQFSKPSHQAPIVRRCIVRYALSCPDEQSQRFIAALRAVDPKLIKTVEESLEQYTPVSPLKKNP